MSRNILYYNNNLTQTQQLYQKMTKLLIIFLLLLPFTQPQCPCSCQACQSRQFCTQCSNNFAFDVSSSGCRRCNGCELENCCSCSNSRSCDLCKWGFKREAYNQTLYRCRLDQNPCQQWNENDNRLIIIITSSVTIFLAVCLCIWLYFVCKFRLERLRQIRVAREEASMAEIDPNSIVIVQPSPRQMPIKLRWQHFEKPATWHEQLCPICLDTSLQMQTSCHHFFHFFCFRDWYLKSMSCSSCRKLVEQFKVICRGCKAKHADVKIEQLIRPIPNLCQQCMASRKQ